MRAKYVVESVYNNGQNVVLVPIVGTPAETVTHPKTGQAVVVTEEVPTPPENVAFFDPKASPGGEIKLPMINMSTAGQMFTAGRKIFVDFTPAD